MILNKVNKSLGLLRKLHNILPRSAMLTIYKDFFRPYLDYGSIIYDQAYDANFHQKLELINPEMHTLLSTLIYIYNNLLDLTNDLTKPILTTTLLFGSDSFDINANRNILNVTMNFVYLLKGLTERFFNEFTDSCLIFYVLK